MYEVYAFAPLEFVAIETTIIYFIGPLITSINYDFRVLCPNLKKLILKSCSSLKSIKCTFPPCFDFFSVDILAHFVDFSGSHCWIHANKTEISPYTYAANVINFLSNQGWTVIFFMLTKSTILTNEKSDI